MIRRRCLGLGPYGCNAMVPHTRSRCDEHEAAWEAARPGRTARPYTDSRHREWRRTVRLRAGGRCQRCGRLDDRPRHPHEADHVHAIVDGGAPFDPDNGRLLCQECHRIKTAEDRARRAGRELLERAPLITREQYDDDARRAGPVIG